MKDFLYVFLFEKGPPWAQAWALGPPFVVHGIFWAQLRHTLPHYFHLAVVSGTSFFLSPSFFWAQPGPSSRKPKGFALSLGPLDPYFFWAQPGPSARKTKGFGPSLGPQFMLSVLE